MTNDNAALVNAGLLPFGKRQAKTEQAGKNPGLSSDFAAGLRPVGARVLNCAKSGHRCADQYGHVAGKVFIPRHFHVRCRNVFPVKNLRHTGI